MIEVNKTINGKAVSYEILDDGYIIYLNQTPWIEQTGNYATPMDSSKSYEENCTMHIEELIRLEESSFSFKERLEAVEKKVNELTYIENALGNGVIEIIKKDQIDAGDYTNPIKYEMGMNVEEGKWYYLNDKDLPREAIKSGKPSSFDDGSYLV